MSRPDPPEPAAPVSPPPPALVAFLRGVERRAALFAELQAGDAEVGDLAVATTMREFQAEAVALPMADWPRRFWQRLAFAPALRQPRPGRWPVGLEHLAGLAAADRIALLSRLAAGLPEDEATEILSLDLSHYRAALAAACPRDAAGDPDAVAWRDLAQAIQQRQRDLPPERMERLARLREHALQPAPRPMAGQHRVSSPAPPQAVERRSRWKRLALVAVVILCVLGLLATFAPRAWWNRIEGTPTTLPDTGLGLSEEPTIQVEPLPPAEAPAATWTADAHAATHPDLPMLRDPDFALAQDAALYAWYAAGTPSAATTPGPAKGEDIPESSEEARDTTF